MRFAAALLLFAVIGLTISSGFWLLANDAAPSAPESARAALVLSDFEARATPLRVDLETRYAGRRDLLDPRLALPVWHTLARDQAVAFHKATKTCPPDVIDALADAALAKALRWHRATCETGAATPDAEALVEGPPFLHPSGRSYAALGLASGQRERAAASRFIRDHQRSFHVLELAALDTSALDDDARTLAALPAPTWELLARGDRLVLTARSLVIAEQGPLGLAALRIYPRKTWDDSARAHGAVLVTRGRSALCARPASSELCWQTLTMSQQNRVALTFATGGSATLVVLSTVFLAGARLRERRRAHADRIHVLRTLTHELRTPATSLRLDIEPLRAAYDEIPVACQEPLLRLSDGIERLQRVLHRSARYMALFETPGAARETLVNARDVASAHAMFEDLAEEWPEGVTLEHGSPDRAFRTDPEWLAVAVRNLVENAARHGRPPIAVHWAFVGEDLVVRVSDGGATPRFSVRDAIRPFARDTQSEGLGLGLAIVSRVAELLRGRLTHEPSPTTFVLRVPVGSAA